MAEILARWNEAETWDELLSLNAESIRQSRECEEEQDVMVVPMYFGPREDCIGAADEYIQPLLDLHKYGILSTSGSPGFNRFGETAVDHGTIFWHSREVPYIEFIIRDKGKETARFINRLLQDERFTMNVLDGFTGKPCFGTENKDITKKICQSATRRAKLEKATWEIGDASFGFPITLEEFCLDSVKALQNHRIYICLIAFKIHDDIIRHRNETRFLQEVNKIDLPHEIRRYAKLSNMKSSRRKFLGRLWVGRGLVSVGKATATQAVLKPTGGFSLALRKRLDAVSKRSPAKMR